MSILKSTSPYTVCPRSANPSGTNVFAMVFAMALAAAACLWSSGGCSAQSPTLRESWPDELPLAQSWAGQAEFQPGIRSEVAIALADGAESSGPCGAEVCVPRLRVQRPGSAPMNYAPPVPCNLGFSAKLARIHADRDTLVLRCRTTIGAGARETLAFVQIDQRGQLGLSLRLETGIEEFPTLEERETPGFSPLRPAGWVATLGGGSDVCLDVFSPAAGSEHGGQPPVNGAGEGWLAPFCYDSKQSAFVERAGGRLAPFDARRSLPARGSISTRAPLGSGGQK